MKRANSISHVLIMSNAKVNGINTDTNRIMDFAEFALKKKLKKRKESRKILILISCLIVKEVVNKKIYRFKRLITV